MQLFPGAGAMTLNAEDPSLVLTTRMKEWPRFEMVN